MIETTLKRTSDSPIPIHSVNPIEDVGTESVNSDDVEISEVVNDYEKALLRYIDPSVLSKQGPAPFTEVVLNPNQIPIFVNLTNNYRDHRDFSNKTGIFIANLIYNSHRNGYNNFKFDEVDIPVFAEGLAGTEDNPIDIEVRRNAGFDSFYKSSYLDLLIHKQRNFRFADNSEFLSVKIIDGGDYIFCFDSKFIDITINKVDSLIFSKGEHQVITCPDKKLLEKLAKLNTTERTYECSSNNPRIKDLFLFSRHTDTFSDIYRTEYYLLEDGVEKEYDPYD